MRKNVIYEIMNYPINRPLPLSAKVKNTIKNLLKNKKTDKYFWPNGLLALGLLRDYEYTQNMDSFIALEKYYNSWIKDGLILNNLDNVLNGYSLISLYEETKDAKYLDSLNIIGNYVLKQPVNTIGSFPYRSHILDIYADGIGMVPAFLCKLGSITNQNELINIGALQIENYLKYGMSESEGLPYHSYNYEENIKKGIVGWGRAVGWILVGIVDSLEHIPYSHSSYQTILNELKQLVDITMTYQNNKGYFHWQLSALDGPIDTSATCMIIYAIDRAIDLNYISKKHSNKVKLGVDAIMSSTKNGFVYDSSAECLGLGLYPQNYSQFPWSLGLSFSLISKYVEYSG